MCKIYSLLLLRRETVEGREGGHLVGVAVAGGSPVLQVAVALLRHVARDPDTGAPVDQSQVSIQRSSANHSSASSDRQPITAQHPAIVSQSQLTCRPRPS